MSGRVVHCKRESYDVFIGRPSKWSNPFTHLPLEKTNALFQVSSREEAIACYEQWLNEKPELLADIDELEGKVLGCWCAPNPCHGDILVRLANEKSKNKKESDNENKG